MSPFFCLLAYMAGLKYPNIPAAEAEYLLTREAELGNLPPEDYTIETNNGYQYVFKQEFDQKKQQNHWPFRYVVQAVVGPDGCEVFNWIGNNPPPISNPPDIIWDYN